MLRSVSWVLYTVAVAVCTCWESRPGCNLSSGSITGYQSRHGDLIIGGTFLVHVDNIYSLPSFTSKPTDLQCQMFGFDYYQSTQAFLFAVEQINSSPDLLPNITLGFQIFETCSAVRRAVQGTLWMLSGGEEITPNYHCHNGAPLAGIIGDSASTRTILMAQILSLYRYPQISYFATSPFLSNRDLFPSFFRTIPSDEFQSRGLAQLISYFGWSWVGLLATDNDYGQFGIQVVKQEIIKAGACVAFDEDIVTGLPNRNAPHLSKIIRESTAKVVIVIATDWDFINVAEELWRQNVTGKIWVASEAWASSDLLSKEQFQEVFQGTIGFAIHSGQMPGFSEYLNSLHPSKDLYYSFLKEFWEQKLSCNWFIQENVEERMDNTTVPSCTGREKLEGFETEADFRLALNVYTSVYAMAWALHDLQACKPGNGPFDHGACVNISSFHPWHLLHYIKNVNFETSDKRRMYFDVKGNSPAVYDIVNWWVSDTGTMEKVKVGSYNSNSTDGNILRIDTEAITWTNRDTQVPISKCSPSCSPGFQKVTLAGKPTCCYVCIPCPQGDISNQTDAVECHRCSWDTWPNLQQDTCIPKTIDYLSYTDQLGISLAAIAISSSIFPLCILGVFLHHQSTPIVQANNRSLSCSLLLSLSFCFLSSLTFIGYPQPENCLLRQVTFGLVFALCISCVLAKTITVVIAFKATKPGSRLRKWTGTKVSYYVIVPSVIIQMCICATWLSLCPPFPENDTKTQPGVITVICNECSPTAFWCMLGYLGLLATISFIVAFLARWLPDSFNEAKFITFSMLAFLTVWGSFIPAYLSARGKYTVAMEIFAILSSCWALVVCIFIPKCYIILFRPNMNSREHLRRRGRGQK
ncbi:extracellular calcium-sensing receptor-like [Rhinophrynus dorsalis]